MAFTMVSSDGQIIAKMNVEVQWCAKEFQSYVVVKCFKGESQNLIMTSIVASEENNYATLWDALKMQIAVATFGKFLNWGRVNMHDSPERNYRIQGWPFCNTRNVYNHEGMKIMRIQRTPVKRLPFDMNDVKKRFPKTMVYKVESQVPQTSDIIRLVMAWATIAVVGYSTRPAEGAT